MRKASPLIPRPAPIGTGALLMLASASFFAVLDGLIKLIGPGFRVWDIAFYRFGCNMAILMAIFGWGRNPFAGHNPRLLVLRGITGSVAFVCLVGAIRLVPISTAMVLFYSFPAFAAIFSPLLFKETITRADLQFVLAAFAGVAVLFDFRLEGGLLGQALGIIAGGAAGLTISTIKKLRETNGPVVIYLYFCVLGTAISLPAFVADPCIPQTPVEWFMVGGIVCSALFAQLLMNQGFRYCKSWEGGLFLMAEVVLTSILGILFLGEPLTWRLCLGGILILGSAVALNRSNTRKNSHQPAAPVSN